MQWEYRVETVGSTWRKLNDEDLESVLNEWGEDGWEVINVVMSAGVPKATVCAKRPLTTRTRRRRSLPGS